MTDEEWLEYDGQTTEELLALAPKYREDSVVVAFETALLEKDRATLTDAERVVLTIEALEREVNHGGFEQFFINSSVEFAPYLVDSLKAIGCPQTAEIAERAIRALGLRAPFGAEEVENVMQHESLRRNKEFDACDAAFNAGSEDLAVSLLAYIRSNAAEIKVP